MTVITISREIGSGGGAIAQQVAAALGYHLVDKQVIEQVLTQYGFAQFREEYEIAPSFWSRFNNVQDQMIEMLDRVVQEFARHGNVVILGRGSFAALGDLADVLNVRIQAPPVDRARRLMTARGIATLDEAKAQIADSDELRSAFIQSWYHTRWDASNAFDLVINTSKMSPALALRWIVEAHADMLTHWAKDEPSTRDLPTETILAETVAGALATPVPV